MMLYFWCELCYMILIHHMSFTKYKFQMEVVTSDDRARGRDN